MNILVVDDDPGIRNSLSLFFTSYGHNTIECENGKIALKILRSENIHMVLSDILMPEMDGKELLKQIKKTERLKELIVVLVTGQGDVKSAVDAMKNGAYDYLLKPVNLNELSILTERVAEYLTLKEENKNLTENFEKKVDEATKDIKKKLVDLRKEYARVVSSSEIGLYSDKLKQVYSTAKRLHKNRKFPVLIEGETGTGKELVARYVHYGDGDVSTPFVGINCAAISPNLFESELFGYEPGAFTGGNPKGQKGKIEVAEEGTIFLDEISEMSIEYQAKLLRVIQEREYYRVGGIKKNTTNARFVCSTNQDIKNKVLEGTFREDLYYRLSVGHIFIPPLRDRSEEIEPLAKMFLMRLGSQNMTQFKEIDVDAYKKLKEYHWPGNVRELKSVVERVALLYDDEIITEDHLEAVFDHMSNPKSKASVSNEQSTDKFEFSKDGVDLNKWILSNIQKALDLNKGNKSDTARYLNISRNVLYTYLKHIKS